MLYPDLDTVISYSKNNLYKNIPVCKEILSDVKTPIEVLKILKNVSSHCYMLESAEDAERWGRYTFLGFDPKLEITCLNGKMKVGDLSFETDNPKKHIRQVLLQHKSPVIPGMPPFTGGLVGYFAFDYIKYAEPTLKLDAEDTEGFKDADLMLFDKVIAFDRLKQKILLIVNIELSNPKENYRKAEIELINLENLIRNGKETEETAGHIKGDIKPLFDEKEFCKIVEKCKERIHEGDIFQIVPSNRLEAEYEGSLLNAYRILRTINPSPYLFYFSSSDLEVAGASPETLVKLDNGILHTFPLAGSRPRGKDEESDKRAELELLSDEKELAEHDMLVDLGRNDLGKISSFKTVEVEKFHTVQRFSHIMHLGSTVKSEIRDDCDALDAIDAVLPAGTLTGAPKLTACRLINEYENNKRGIYGGAVGYLDFTGNLDMCIGIRLAYKKNGKVFIRSGAGIVADSIPKKEYEECKNKAAALIEALKLAGEGCL